MKRMVLLLAVSAFLFVVIACATPGTSSGKNDTFGVNESAGLNVTCKDTPDGYECK